MTNLKIEYRKLRTLRGYANNPMRHPEDQILALCDGIRRFGFTNPILLDAQGEIIAGHGRLEAAQRLQLDEVPCIVLGHLSEAEKRAYRIADNKLAHRSTFDMDALLKEFEGIAELDATFDLGLTGFEPSELDALMEGLEETANEVLATTYEQTPSTSPTPEAQGQAEESEQAEAEEETPQAEAKEPKASDEQYSLFELVMLHANKLHLLDVLNKIKAEQMFEKHEDALMELVRRYGEGK